MNKEGQFFLIAALVIVGIVVGLGAISITTRTAPTETAVYDLSKEIDYESNQVIDSGIYQSLSSGEISQDVISLASDYSALNPGTDILVVYGNEEGVTGVLFSENSTGFAGISTGGGQGAEVVLTTTFQRTLVTDINRDDNIIIVYIDPNAPPREFDLQPGQNFYLILRRTVGEEQIVAER